MRVLDAPANQMLKLIITMAGAAVVAGAIVFATSVAPNAADAASAQASANGERRPAAVTGAACSQHGWPNFEQSCQFDFRRPANKARTVRILALR
jgi:hypothetical protein